MRLRRETLIQINLVSVSKSFESTPGVLGRFTWGKQPPPIFTARWRVEEVMHGESSLCCLPGDDERVGISEFIVEVLGSSAETLAFE